MSEKPSAGLRAMIKTHRERSERERTLVLDAYDRMAAQVVSPAGKPRRTALADVMRATYRCPRGCTLLEVFATPETLRETLHAHPAMVARRPPHTLSAAVAEADSDPGRRAERTTDGDGRQWRAEVVMLDDLLGAGGALGVPLQCDHIRLMALSPDEVAESAGRARQGKPFRKIVHPGP